MFAIKYLVRDHHSIDLYEISFIDNNVRMPKIRSMVK